MPVCRRPHPQSVTSTADAVEQAAAEDNDAMASTADTAKDDAQEQCSICLDQICLELGGRKNHLT